MNDNVFQNRYILNKKLGTGSMGEVYIATDRLSGQEIALKRVLKFLPSGANMSRFTALALTNEFQLLASLRHPNIVSVLDYGIDQEGLPFLTMTYLRDGVSLLHAAAGKSVKQRVDLLLQVLDALKYLNRRGIVHRDLKPENILVMPDDTVRVLDFGLATDKMLSERSDISGTIVYMAPELLTDGTPTIQSDLYSIGVMAYEMFTGSHPYKSTGVQALVYEILNTDLNTQPLIDAIQNQHALADAQARAAQKTVVHAVSDETIRSRTALPKNPPPPTPIPTDAALREQAVSSASETPGALVAIITRLLARKAENRYSDPQQVITDLCRAIGEDTVSSGAASRESFLQAATFVGRSEELGKLEEALDAAIAGIGSLWMIGGESGVGKSRLVNEIRHVAMIKGALVLTGEVPPEGAQPFEMWREPVKRLLLQSKVSDADAGALKLLVPDVERLLDRTLDTTEPPPPLEEAVLRLFHACTEPILLLLEDLHWALPEGLQLLKALQQTAPQSHLLIVGNYRIDETPKLTDQFPGCKRIKLARLDQKATAELVASMVGKTQGDARLISALQKETEGNVFFLIETVRALAEETGTLESIHGQTLPSQLFTGGMQKIIQRRLDRVPEPYRPLLNAAALRGRELETDLLKKMGGTVDVEDWLTTLANAAVIEFLNERWRFAHDKLREHLTQSLAAEDRRVMHRDLALTLEAMYPDGRRADALVVHWRGAGETDKEIHYIRIAGRRAEQMGAYEEARRLYERALELANEPIQQIEFNNLLGGLYEYRSEYADAERYLKLALDMARQHQQQGMIADILDKLAWIHIRHGQLDEASEKATEVLKIARETGSDIAILHGLSLSGIVHHIKGEMQQAYDLFMEGLPIAEKSGEPYTLATHLNSLGAAEDGLGRADDAIRTLTRASELAQQLGNPALLGNIEGNLGHLLYNKHQFSEAHVHFVTALLAFRKAGNAYGDALAGYYLGYIMLHMGDSDHAREYLRDSLKFSLEIGAAMTTLGGLVGVAEFYRIQGEPVRAAELIGLVRAHPLTASDADVQREADVVFAQLPTGDTEIDAAVKRGESLPMEETARHEADQL